MRGHTFNNFKKSLHSQNQLKTHPRNNIVHVELVKTNIFPHHRKVIYILDILCATCGHCRPSNNILLNFLYILLSNFSTRRVREENNKLLISACPK